MKNLRWQLIIIFVTGLIVGVLLLTQQPAPGTPAAVPAPEEGGVYTEGLIGGLQRLNPLLDAYNQPDRDVDSLIFSGLMKTGAMGHPQPDLAENWGVSQDGTIYNLAMRKDARWHDGELVTTDDVMFTIDLMRNLNGYVPEDLAAFWNEVDVQRFDAVTLQFRLPEAYAPFLDYLTFKVLPKHLLESISLEDLPDAGFNLAPVGSGPYRFDHLLVESGQIKGIVLSANTDYYAQKPYIEQVVFRYYPDSQAILAAYQQAEIQGMGKVTADILPAALADSKLGLYAAREPELSLVLFNLNNTSVDFFKDKAIRRALLSAINRQWLIDHILNGQAILADGPLLPGTWAYYDGLERIPYNSQAAEQVLKDAGYILPAEGDPIRQKDGKAISFTLLVPSDDPEYASIAEAIRSDWAAIGVGVQLESLPYADLVSQRLEPRTYEAALVSLNLTGSPDPDPYPFWDQAQAAGGQNYSAWNDRNASEYIEQARITTDVAERTKLYRNFQIIFVEEMPALPLYYPVYNYGVDLQVQGVSMGPLVDPSARFATITDWYLIARRTNAPAATQTP